MSKVRALDTRRKSNEALDTPTDLADEAVREISTALNGVLADSFALYLKTKNFHWHVSGPHFRDYHLLLDEQARADLRHHRRAGRAGPQDRRHHAALDRPYRQAAAHRGQRRGIRAAARHAARADERQQGGRRRRCAKAHEVADEHDDVGTASLLENFIDADRKARPGSCSRRAARRQHRPATDRPGRLTFERASTGRMPRASLACGGSARPVGLLGVRDPSDDPSRDISRLLEIMAALRTPGTGCPWDLEQDFRTIAPYTHRGSLRGGRRDRARRSRRPARRARRPAAAGRVPRPHGARSRARSISATWSRRSPKS